jgi:hypothetical protein
VHAGFDAPAVDINVGNDGGTPEVEGLERFADTGAAGVALPAATELQIGIEVDGDVVTAFTTPELAEGAEVFVIATGQLGRLAREDEGFSLLAVLPDGTTAFIRQNPRVYALHASPDAGAVDIFAGDAELVDSARFGDLAGIQVPPGAYELDFFGAEAGASDRPTGDPAATAETPELEAGQSYLAIAAGELTATTPTFGLIPVVEGFEIEEDGARVRVIHASADAPEVDLGTVTTTGDIDTPPLLSELEFGDVSDPEGLAVPAAALRLGLSASGSTATAAEFELTTTDGLRAFVVAAGAFSGGANGFRLFVIDTTATPWAIAAVRPE